MIITARLDPVTVMNEDGQPTKEKDWKIQAHKSLPFDATAIIEMRERGQFRITKVKSARVQLESPKAYPEFTVDNLWDRLGLTEGTGARTHATVRADRSGREPGAQSQGEQVSPEHHQGPAALQPPAGPVLEKRAPQQDWIKLAREAKSRPQLRPVYQQAEAAGDLNVAVRNPNTDPGQPEFISLRDWMWALRDQLPERAPATKKDDVPENGDAWAPSGDASSTDWPTAPIPSDEAAAA